MPRVFIFGSFCIFFWTNEGTEPIHVPVAVKRPVKGATKIWLTSKGGCMVASNGSKIPAKDLDDIQDFIVANHEEICERWTEIFGDTPRFHL